MRLADYLQDHTATKVAEECGVAVSTITRIARGEINPRVKLIRKIVTATGGAVTASSFIEQVALAPVPVTTEG